MATVETARLQLRPWETSELDELARLYADPVVMRYISGRPLTREEAAAISAGMVRQWEMYGFGPWSVLDKTSGAWLGQLGLNRLDDWPDVDRVEVGWALHQQCWGRGLATEGARAALQYGFATHRLPRIISVTVPANTASRRVMEKAGLTYQSSRAYRNTDVVWYAIDAASWSVNSLSTPDAV